VQSLAQLANRLFECTYMHGGKIANNLVHNHELQRSCTFYYLPLSSLPSTFPNLSNQSEPIE
jgi:hypothetical protein